MSPITYSGASCSSAASRQLRAPGPARTCAAISSTTNEVLRHRERMVADGLAVPARDAGQAMGDVPDLDVQRRGIKQVQPAAGQHPLPRARSGREPRLRQPRLVGQDDFVRQDRLMRHGPFAELGAGLVAVALRRWSLTMPTACRTRRRWSARELEAALRSSLESRARRGLGGHLSLLR